MWRAPQTSRQGRQVLNIAKRHLAAEAGPKSAPPPLPPLKPQQPKTGGYRFLKLIGLTVPLASGALLAYAWYDQDFRQQLETSVPYAKEILGNVLPESSKPVPVLKPEKPVLAPALDAVSPQSFAPPPPLEKPASDDENGNNEEEDVAKNMLNENSETEELYVATDSLPGLEGRVPTNQSSFVVFTELGLQREKTKQKETTPEPLVVKELEAKENAKSKPDPSEVQAELKRKADEEKADNAALEVVIHKLLKNSQLLTEEAVKAQRDVAEATRNHTKLLRLAMDDTSDILQKDAQWEAVAAGFQEREKAVQRSNELVEESKKSIEKLRDVLAEGKTSMVTKNNPAIYPARKRVAELTKDLSQANTQVRNAESEAKVMLKYKDLVDKGKKQFQKELESLFPDVQAGKANRKLSEEELNALIAHAHRRIEQLQRQLAEQLTMEQKRLGAALELQREEDKMLAEVAVSEEANRLKSDFESEKQRLEMEFLVDQENEVRKQLARQAAAHSDHLKDVLAVQYTAVSKDFERTLNLKLLEEREKFQTEVANWISRLKGIEAAIDERAASEKLAHYAQDLWLACISLNSSIHFGPEDEKLEIKPLKEEMNAILKAANKHPFVETVVSTFPQEAIERGVYTEEALRDRFVKVSAICKRLGLLNDANRSLYKYLISYLHSFFVFDNVWALSEKDFVNVDDFDNFDLVSHAQYWMEHGNLEMALRYMNQLRGESKEAAKDWIKEVKLLLETRQSASTLTAYASATGLANTF